MSMNLTWLTAEGSDGLHYRSSVTVSLWDGIYCCMILPRREVCRVERWFLFRLLQIHFIPCLKLDLVYVTAQVLDLHHAFYFVYIRDLEVLTLVKAVIPFVFFRFNFFRNTFGPPEISTTS